MFMRLAAGCVGMGAGLAVDTSQVAPAALVALCAAPGTLADALRLHLLAMPWSMLVMLFAPWAARARGNPAQSALAAAAMVLGMVLGSRSAAPLHALGMDAFAALLLAMAAGMALAMALAGLACTGAGAARPR